MTIYFLSTQSLLDVISGNAKIHEWLTGISLQQIEISAVSVGQALATIQQNSNGAVRNSFERQLEKLVTTVRSTQGVIPFDEDAARIWADLEARSLEYRMPDDSVTELSLASRMVVATALLHEATLVESPQPYHAAIAGLHVVSP